MTLSADYFHAQYEGSDDPWNLASSAYEQAKYAATIDALPDRIFASGFEVGCAVGVLTRLLARRTQHLLSIDIAEQALRLAAARCAGEDNILFRRMAVPGEWPDRRFDLIVISELLYYFSPDDVRRIAARSSASIMPGGIVLLVHWIRPTDLPLPGDEAVSLFIAATPRLRLLAASRTDTYRLDLLEAAGEP